MWECGDGHLTSIGSLAELSQLAGRDLSGLDPHRPYVDEVVITCPECGRPAHRVPEVIDAWYDSGSMPFARLGAPLRNEEDFRRAYPAQILLGAWWVVRAVLAMRTIQRGPGRAYQVNA